MQLRFPKFTDPMYSAEQSVQFDVSDVLAIEQKQISLLMRGKFWATYITLKNGAEYALKGQVAAEIEAAQAKVRKVGTAI